MFQKPAHNGKDLDAVGEAWYAGHQAADAPHVHDDLHPRLAGLGQLVDKLAVGDRVDLEKNEPAFSRRGLCHLPVYEFQQLGLQPRGGHQQLLIRPGEVGGGHVLEEGGGVRPNGGVGGHEGKVSVHPGGFLIIVPCADLGDVLDAAPLPPGDQADLGVDLIALRPVEKGAARLLQPLCPADVVLFVEPGAQLHQDGDILSIFRCGAQVVHQLGVGGQAVDGDTDGEHGGVGGGLAYQTEEGLHGVVGIVKQHVVPQDLGDHVFLAGEGARPAGGAGGIAQHARCLGGQLALQGIDILHDQGGAGGEDLFALQPQALAEKVHQGIPCAVLDLQAHGSQAAALFQHVFHAHAEVVLYVVVLVLGADVGVAGDRDDCLVQHLIGVEQGVGMGEKDMLGEQVVQGPLLRQVEGGEGFRDWDQAEIPLPVPAQGQGHGEGFGGQVGEGVVAVHHDGGEHWEDELPAVAVHLLALLAVQLIHGQPADAPGAQTVFQLGQGGVPPGIEGHTSLEDGPQLLGGGHAALVVHMGLLEQGHVSERAHPDHIELVQVPGKNGGEFQPLEQGDLLVGGLVQHPLIEPQPGQLPVLGIAHVDLLSHECRPP